ncbi:MAG: PhzF family phenazine biosynthesis protein [Alphaproteobacteria bacterium]|nr:PhzF family phenazine biosynthesis protein [Alphaproteobacteria bacterium]
MKHRYYTADVFTDTIFGGNPLAVVTDADALTDTQMQKVAAEFNLPETTFIQTPADPQHACRVRIFTPKAELPFAGHPTVGTALILAWTGAVATPDGDNSTIVLEEGLGPVPVVIDWEDGAAVRATLTTATLPDVGPPPPDTANIAAMLGLDIADIHDDPSAGATAPVAMSCGVPFVFVPLRDRAALARVQLDHSVWRKHLKDHWAPSLYLFTRDAARDGADIQARMFAPVLGVPEDPATGSAVASLAAFLAPRSAVKNGTARWVVDQGIEMGRPSTLVLEADLEDRTPRAIRVGGAAVLVREGEIEIPSGE